MPVPEGLPKMQYRLLGRSGLQVSAISLGGWLTYGGHVENENTFSCMKAAYDVGINFFDCAEGYSNGDSERIMGQAIKKFAWKRNDIVVSTKIFWGEAFGENPVNNRGLSRKHIIEGLNGSLERLGLEYVDILFAHRPDRNTPIEETVRAFNHVINTGKALYWGTSEWDADEIATAWRYADKLGLIGPVVEQPQYNMLTRHKVEKELAHLYQEVGLGLTVFSPLKVGILTGKYNDGIPENSRLASSSDPSVERMRSRVGGKEWDSFISVVAKLKPVADRLDISQANLALAWVLANGNVSSAITGASHADQIYESVRSLAVIEKLSPEIMAEIDGILGNKPPVMKRRQAMS